MIAVRSGGPNQSATMLTNADGETTSHIQGMFNRTIRFLTEGIKPAYIFDGKPPEFKSGELLKRRQKREKAQAELKKAAEDGNVEEQDKQSKRLVRAGHKENQDCQRLLELMGVPVIVAPCEAEAQASALCKDGLFYATATEDMDALTFQTPVLVRKMTFANQSKSMVQTMDYKKAVEGLGLTHEQFVDLCILLGCDYTGKRTRLFGAFLITRKPHLVLRPADSIKGIGPKSALKLIREHKSIEAILKVIDRQKYTIPSDWIPEDTQADDDSEGEADENNENDQDEKPTPAFVQARKLFHHHEVTKGAELKETLKWKEPKVEELTKFLVDQNGFNPERVKASIEKLQKAFGANKKPQSRMDSFFTIKANPLADQKRKKRVEEQKKNKKQKTATKKKR